MLGTITLVKHPFGCYALSAPGVEEDREPFFQIDYDVVALAEHIGYKGKTYTEEEGIICDWTELGEDEQSAHFRGAYDYLDERAGEEMDPNIVDAYFSEEDRGWE